MRERDEKLTVGRGGGVRGSGGQPASAVHRICKAPRDVSWLARGSGRVDLGVMMVDWDGYLYSGEIEFVIPAAALSAQPGCSPFITTHAPVKPGCANVRRFEGPNDTRAGSCEWTAA